jgi:prepilin-type N-terminal cleavage/methylation domain-containing protein
MDCGAQKPVRPAVGSPVRHEIFLGAGSARRPDISHEGFTLVEVIIAMAIFSIVSIGVLYGLLSVLSITKDSRDRQVATNLASEEIDLVRAADDLFALDDNSRTVELNGDTFTVARTARWISDPTEDLACGSSDELRYKRVSVRVTWANMRSTDAAVETFTVINPKERINEADKGTIVVSVVGVNGAPVPGVSVSAKSSSNVVTPGPETNSQGCSYIVKLAEDDYTVSATKADYVDELQNATSTKTVQVAKGVAVAAAFQYDAAAKVTIQYAKNYTAATPTLPTNLDTSFVNTYGTFVVTGGITANKREVSLHPYSSGYAVVAGEYAQATDTAAGCPAVDPQRWTAGTESGTRYVPPAQTLAQTDAGVPKTITVPMGVVKITSGASNRYFAAVSQNATPACTDGTATAVMSYSFPRSTSSTATLALPYGSWKIYSSSSPISGASGTLLSTNLSPLTKGAVTSSVLKLDPRVVG